MQHRLQPAAALAAVLLLTAPLAAQVVRLPPVEPPPERQTQWVEPELEWAPAATPVPPEFTPYLPPVVPPEEIWVLPPQSPPVNPDRPLDARDGFFQKLLFDSTWIAPWDSDSLEVLSLELRTVLALPLPSRQWPLILKPGFGVHFFDGPTGRDVPSEVYDSYLQFRWFRRLNPRWMIDLSVTPGVYSDFDHSSDDALRITGHGVAMYTWSPALKLIGGVAYVNREDYQVLPAVGLIWTPRDDVKLELLFPKPELAWRLRSIGPPTEAIEDWVYLSGEFGGGRWAVKRTDGSEDVFAYDDVRVILGWEHKQVRGIDTRAEIGYVFAREYEYESRGRERSLGDALLLRAGFTY